VVLRVSGVRVVAMEPLVQTVLGICDDARHLVPELPQSRRADRHQQRRQRGRETFPSRGNRNRYSRSATVGSRRAARLAGTSDARVATTRKSAIIVVNVSGSAGVTPTSIDLIARVMPGAAINPITIPAAHRRRPSKMTIRRIDPWRAPK